MERKTSNILVAIIIVIIFASGFFLLEHYYWKAKSLSRTGTSPARTMFKRLMGGHTRGSILPNDEIYVRFQREILELEDRKNFDAEVFSFDPPIKGKAYWSSPFQLNFKPDVPLKMGQKYKGQLDMNALMPEKRKRRPLDLVFSVLHREVTILAVEPEAEFMKEYRLRYRGHLEFSLPLDYEQLKKGLDVTFDRKKIDFTLEEETDKKFYFVTDFIPTDKQSSELEVVLDAEILELKETIEKKYSIDDTDMEVYDLRASLGASDVSILVEFTSLLDERQNLDGFFSSEPAVDFKVRSGGTFATLTGNFDIGTAYKIVVRRGIRSVFGKKLKEDTEKAVWIENLDPELSWIREGAILPQNGPRKLQFKTVNLKRVTASVFKIYDHNLGYYLQTWNLESSFQQNQSRSGYGYGPLENVGVKITDRKIDLATTKNQPTIHELDLTGLIDEDPRGLYYVTLWFNLQYDVMKLERPQDASPEITKLLGSRTRNNRNYYREYNTTITKPILISDIGMSMQKEKEACIAHTTNLTTGMPESGVKVDFYNFQTHNMASAITGQNGRCSVPVGDYNYITAEKNGVRSVLHPASMEWEISDFRVEGKDNASIGTTDYTRGFIYTDRGVHRPGDTIHIGMILRNRDNTFPDNHPVTIKVVNPTGQQYTEETLTGGHDGFYTYDLATQPSDPTGIWRLNVQAGAQNFSHQLRIETVVPEKFKVELETEGMLPVKGKFEADVAANYLFGAPASGRPVEVKLQYFQRDRKVERFPGFYFGNDDRKFKDEEKEIFSGTLDQDGKARFTYDQPDFPEVPSELVARISVDVMEEGGRKSSLVEAVPREVYPYYVGLKKPAKRYKYYTNQELPVVVVDRDGNPLAGERLTWRLYRNRSWGWWHWDSHYHRNSHYKTSEQTVLIETGMVVSQGKPVMIPFEVKDYGRYFLEVERHDSEGHVAGVMFNVGWAPNSGQMAAPELIHPEADRDIYFPGDTANIHFRAPVGSRILVNLGAERSGARQLLERGRSDRHDARSTGHTGYDPQHLLRDIRHPALRNDGERPAASILRHRRSQGHRAQFRAGCRDRCPRSARAQQAFHLHAPDSGPYPGAIHDRGC